MFCLTPAVEIYLLHVSRGREQTCVTIRQIFDRCFDSLFLANLVIQSSIFCQVPQFLKWPRLFTLSHIYYRTWFVDREGSTIHSFFARGESSCRQSSVISSLKGSKIRTQVIYSLILHPSQGVLRFNSISSIALTVVLSSPLRWSSHFRLIWRLCSSMFQNWGHNSSPLSAEYMSPLCEAMPWCSAPEA